ncbi:short-subunit dehydrogenase [Chryseobacterium ginsenosidimutans]|uniref:SDR family NAD(P)-dependent oxidoreductase n=1 Tax=Chryseobacterium ginsenosidimutans TaxID=687846 RepID=UPI00278ADC00|nr:SDR family oxidoreductase [Chryseobacterium ginsenosidimutans]MDQ0595045.1 short-subunit dehydrogenase [Chryseobacterium ginsenosidimutans]
MKEYILITGASSGIGYHMAIQLAEKEKNLILVARSEEKLKVLQEELTSLYPISVYYIVKDLSKEDNAIALYNEVQEKNLLVAALVNNAGVGGYGEFINTSLEEELKMIDLNISSLVALNKLFAKDMVERKSGRIMNIASLMSFLPLPYYSVYSATKAFVLAFTETLAAELEGTGVVVTALCPGPIDTGFNTKEMMTTNVLKTNKPVHPEVVADAGVKLLLYGKGKKIVGSMNWFISNLPRVTPDFLMMKIKKHLASQR